jgi:hypothetical protein
MSDWEQAPGTTTVMPPAPPTGTSAGPGPAPGPGGRSGVPLWVLIVALLAAILVTGTVVYLIAAGGVTSGQTELALLKAKNDALTAQIDSLQSQITSANVAVATANAKAAAAAGAAPEEPLAPATQFTFINKVTGSSAKGFKVVVQYAKLLTGEAAADAATAHGDESPPPNDYYIVSDDPALRTFTLSKTAKIVVLGWAGADATKKKTVTIAQFMSVMPGGSKFQDRWANAPYTITISAGTVTQIEQYYLP